MTDERSITVLKSIQTALRDALEWAARYGDASIWNRVATTLGSVRAEIGRIAVHAEPLTDAEGPAPAGGRADGAPSIGDLAEMILAALASAEALGRDDTALILNDALISVTGRGISPEGWPPA
ncbi:hypothetical protein [Sphingomonas colocasiae]|uniref:NTP pyrophosphohydrolase MazG putative catalytic core domain-containing protein n=1 Tax=Sphingomonas colocasiae TaxID=1848973 RepID=A0ABS7Q1R8_9SPHN|nr:hypothetical protein [Sphingomonas colocasiae]MBY8826169.1 hypothetical protein [Sphingomonas colocasiae]